MRQQYRDWGMWSCYIIRSRWLCMRELHINMEYGTGAQSYILKRCQEPHLTTVYSIACKFNALTDMEELQIQKSSDLPNNHLIFRFELHFGYNMEPPY